MTTLEFRGYRDAGAPTLQEVDGVLSIAYEAGERGRWLTDNITAVPGEVHTVAGQYRVSDGAVAAPVVVLWKAGQQWQLHGTVAADVLRDALEEFAAFVVTFNVPEGVDAFRVELRSWAGGGVSEFRGVELDPEAVPEPPPDPDLPQRELTGFVRGRMLTVQDVTAGGAELPEWECFPVRGMAWGDDIFLTVVRPEPEPSADE